MPSRLNYDIFANKRLLITKILYMNKIILVTLMLLTISQTFSQNVTGRIIDENGKAIEYANVILLSLPDSIFLSGTISNQDGTFSVQLTSQNSVLKVSSIGYKTCFKRYLSEALGVLVLESNTQNLSEVIITASRPVFKMDNGNIETKIQGSLLSSLGNANDVLRNIPSVAEKNGSYTVFGKGAPLVFIDNKQVRDNVELERLQSSNIKSIQVINNPGSRYDSDVKAVILIKTIKKEGEGVSLDIRSVFGQSKTSKTSQEINFNYRDKKMDIFTSINYKLNRYEYNSDINQRVFVDTIWEQKNYENKKFDTQILSYTAGFNYELNDYNSFGATYTIDAYLKNKENINFNSSVNANDSFYDSWTNTSVKNIKHDPKHQLNTYYNGRIKKICIDFNFDFLTEKSTKQNYASELSQNFNNRIVTSNNYIKSKLYAAKLVLSYPIFNGELSIGEEMSHTWRKDIYDNEQGIVASSDNQIKENRYATFIEYSRPLWKYTNFKVGLRYENVSAEYYRYGKKVGDQSRNYNDFFPAIGISGLLNKNIQYSLSYTVKTKRPNYSQLSGNVDYMNRFTYQSGNPYLRQITTHDITLSGLIARFIQFSFSYQHQNDPIIWYMEQLKSNQAITLVNFKNLKKLDNLTGFISLSPKFGFWHPQLNFGVQKQWLSIDYLNIKKTMNEPMYMGAFNNSFELSSEFILNIDLNTFQSRGNYQNIYLNKNIFVFNASLRKSFFKKRLNVNLQVFDIFKKQIDGNIIYNPQMVLSTTNYYDSRKVQLTFSYKFNMIKSNYKGKGAGNEEKQRL